MLKSYGVVGGWWWVAWSNLVSAQGPLVLGLGPGLDNSTFMKLQKPISRLASIAVYLIPVQDAQHSIASRFHLKKKIA